MYTIDLCVTLAFDNALYTLLVIPRTLFLNTLSTHRICVRAVAQRVKRLVVNLEIRGSIPG